MLKLCLLLLAALLVFPPARRVLAAGLKGVVAVWRPTTGLLAIVALTAAAVLAMREDWWPAAALTLAAAAAALAARKRAAVKRPVAAGADGAMSPRQARSILGVPEGAGPEAVEAAYRRLMLRAHPDQGGTAGLAAQLNAARAALRGGPA